jgi:hypothetical protein
VIVPTQRKITPFDAELLADTGVKALMIGAIVTGTTAHDLEWATRIYRNALDAISSRDISPALA